MAKNNVSLNPSDAFIQSMERGRRRKKRLLIIMIGALVLLIIAGIVVGMKIRRDDRIAMAKSVIEKLDISTTYKQSEFYDGEDWDGDGVINSEEKRQSLNIQGEDTDGDGIIDGDEVKMGTNPAEPDTDGDGLYDGYELMAGLDPRTAMTDGSTKDSDRIMTVERKSGDCTLTIEGDANAASVTMTELDLFGITSNASIVTKAYDSYSEHQFAKATITFNIDKERVERLGYSMDGLTVLKFDSTNTTYTKVDSTVNAAAGTVSAEILSLGTYVVGVEETANMEATTRVNFLIDNSGSMYPVELCPTSPENDLEFKRIDFTKSLIKKLDENCLIGLSKFTGSYDRLMDFTTDKGSLNDTLERLRDIDEFFDGTHSQTALLNCIGEFDNSDGGKYRNVIVMLTDGQSDEADPAPVEDIIEAAQNKNIIVLTIGLGRDVDRPWLQELASSTGGKYYSASDANALNDVYQQIVTTLNYDIVEFKNNDDEVRGYSLFNTGFNPKMNGFEFKNFRTTTTASVDFGMAVLARDWYLGNVQTSLGPIEPADKSDIKVNADGYDLSGTDVGEAYESRLQLHSIPCSIFTGKYADINQYLDFTSGGDVLKIKEDYSFDCRNKGWLPVNTKIEGANLSWQSVELLSLDIADRADKIASGYSKGDAELAKCLYRLNALQWDDSADEFNLNEGEEKFDLLEQQLSLGVPVVATIDDTHSVNIIGLIQDSECHRQYMLQIYDNNYPDETKELFIEKLPKCVLSVADDGTPTLLDTGYEYTATYEGKQVGVSFSLVQEH
jgi:hypothetical protein